MWPPTLFPLSLSSVLCQLLLTFKSDHNILLSSVLQVPPVPADQGSNSVADCTRPFTIVESVDPVSVPLPMLFSGPEHLFPGLPSSLSVAISFFLDSYRQTQMYLSLCPCRTVLFYTSNVTFITAFTLKVVYTSTFSPLDQV